MPMNIKDLAALMPEQMGAEEEGPIDENMLGMAMAARGAGPQEGVPQVDYAAENPYADGGHGSWASENLDMLDGLAGKEFEGNLDLDVIDEGDQTEDIQDMLIEEDMELGRRSNEYQKRAAGDEEEEEY